MKEETKKLLEKADRSIYASEVMLKEKQEDFAASRAYYAMFYISEALLCEKNVRRLKKHSAVHSFFGRLYVRTGLLDEKFHHWLLDAFDNRLRSDYDVDRVLGVEDVQLMIRQAREFLDVARQHLSQSSSS